MQGDRHQDYGRHQQTTLGCDGAGGGVHQEDRGRALQGGEDLPAEACHRGDVVSQV